MSKNKSEDLENLDLLFRQRTRFLPALDDMIRQDRQGVIDDMLQVLQECGVIKECVTNFEVAAWPLEMWSDPNYQNHLKERMSDQMGHFLMKEGKIEFKFRPGTVDNDCVRTRTMEGRITVVVRPKK